VFINGFIPNNKLIDLTPQNTSVTSKENNSTMVVEPTDEIYDRPIVQNDDGTYSTAENTDVVIDKEYYKKFNLPDVGENQGYLAIIATVYDKEHHSYEEAVEHFYTTGLHFGIFLVTLENGDVSEKDIETTEKYATDVHNAQEEYTESLNNALTIGLRTGNFKMDVDDTGSVTIKGLSVELTSDADVTINTPNFNCTGSVNCGNGVSGTFNTSDGKTITVTSGIITGIE
jgi:hypothetical protein